MDQVGKAQNPERDPADLLRFRQEWTELAKFFAHASRLPANERAFETRYGTFQEKSGVRQFLSALQEVNEVAQSLGNPASLKERISEDGDYLFKTEPPGVIYHHLLWLATHIANAASTVKKGYADLAGLFDMPGPPGSRAQGVKRVLVGNGGLASTAARAQSEVRQLTDNLEPFVPRLMQAVRTFNQTALFNEANQTIGYLEEKTRQAQKRAEEAKRKAKAWYARKTRREQYEGLLKEIEAKRAEIERKRLFVHELDGFSVAADRVVPAVKRIDNKLKGIEKLFADLEVNAASVCKLATGEQLSDRNWVARALSLSDEMEKWDAIENAAHDSVQQAMVSFDAHAR